MSVAFPPDHDIARAAPVGLRTLKPPQSERLLNRGVEGRHPGERPMPRTSVRRVVDGHPRSLAALLLRSHCI